ncbi:MAG: hypothetical protein QNJ64_08390 [Crocosphaera sp.]|nr:hypothetical protein [Crocosphaera sp.]
MTKKPTFRVFPKSNSYWNAIKIHFLDGIPCDRIVHPCNDCLIPIHNALNISFDNCSNDQICHLVSCVTQHQDVSECEVLTKGIKVDFKDIDICLDQLGKRIDLNYLADHLRRELTEYGEKFIFTSFTSLDLHGIITGLQLSCNSLFSKDDKLVDFFLLQASSLVRRLGMDETVLKQYYLYRFIPELQERARELLFPQPIEKS